MYIDCHWCDKKENPIFSIHCDNISSALSLNFRARCQKCNANNWALWTSPWVLTFPLISVVEIYNPSKGINLFDCFQFEFVAESLLLNKELKVNAYGYIVPDNFY